MRLLKYTGQFVLVIVLTIALSAGVLFYGFTMFFGVIGGTLPAALANDPYFTPIMYILTGVWVVSAIGLVREFKEGQQASNLSKSLVGSLAISTLLGIAIPLYYAEYVFF